MANKRKRSEIRHFVRLRARGRCEYCLSPEKYSTGTFSVEHIVPTSLGGTDESQNLALACQACNNFKYIRIKGIDPITYQLVNLYDPRRDKWRDHFVWDLQTFQLLGITPVGRASIETLRLNRETLLNLRELLQQIGQFPPE